MRKIKNFFKIFIQVLFNPIKVIASINISEKFISFMNKHIWLRVLISFILMAVIVALVYYIK